MASNDDFCAIGQAITNPCFSHETCDGKHFYFFFMFAKRHSGVFDMFRCVIPHDLTAEVEEGKEIEIYGEIRTHNTYDGDKRHTMVYVLVREVYTAHPEAVPTDRVFLDGYICKKPIVRDAPLGRRICNLIVEVNHPYGRSSYIPCIVWGASADMVGEKNVGDRIMLRGRLQSREYEKDGRIRTAYEVSVEQFGEKELGHGKGDC